MIKVITYGTFDLFHQGHYNLLKRAKELGDYLIVGVTSESYDRERGKVNVIDPLITRMENVKKTGFADEIIVEEDLGQKISDIRKYGIDIFTVGSDWTGKFDYLNEYCKVVYLKRTKGVSSTLLRKDILPIIRAGIIGTGRIAGRFIPEATAVSGINVQSVYNPHAESEKKFGSKWNLDTPDSLEAFWNGIDIVYIASPHITHFEYAKQALEHGKHVLCEKPLALKKAEATELYDLAKKKNVVLYEGIKTAYCPCFEKVIGTALGGSIGNIRAVDATFTKLENPSGRELSDPVYGGSFTELASYCLLPAIKLLGVEYSDIRFESILADNGIDLLTRCFLRYPNAMTTATCGLGAKSNGELVITGTKGYIVVAAPWWKTSYFEVRYEDPDRIERYSDRFLGDGIRYELADMINMINGKKRHGFKLTAEDSIALAGIMEQFMQTRKK